MSWPQTDQPELVAAPKYLRRGDIPVVWSSITSPVGQGSPDHRCELHERGIGVRILTGTLAGV